MKSKVMKTFMRAKSKGAPIYTEPLDKWAKKTEWHDILLTHIRNHFEKAYQRIAKENPDFVKSRKIFDDYIDTEESSFYWLCMRQEFYCGQFPGKGNVIDAYLNKKGSRLSIKARRYLEALRDSKLSLFKVTATDKGKLVTLQDMLFDGDEITAKHTYISFLCDINDGVAARILDFGDEKIISRGFLRFKAQNAHTLAQDILLPAGDKAASNQNVVSIGINRTKQPQKLQDLPQDAEPDLSAVSGRNFEIFYRWLHGQVCVYAYEKSPPQKRSSESIATTLIAFKLRAKPPRLIEALSDHDRIVVNKESQAGASRGVLWRGYLYPTDFSPDTELQKLDEISYCNLDLDGRKSIAQGYVELYQYELLIYEREIWRALEAMNMFADDFGNLLEPGRLTMFRPTINQDAH